MLSNVIPSEVVGFEARQAVATLTLNRPDSANAINAEFARELRDAALRCSDDPGIRAVVLQAEGSMFCGGGDLRSFAAQASISAHLKQVTMDLYAAVSCLTRVNAPLVAAVQGFAAEGGLSLALCCDFVPAGGSARFKMAYTRAGLTPDGSSTYFLPQLLGLRRAMELAITNRTLDAAQALEWGLITRVVADETLREEAACFAAELADGPLEALGRDQTAATPGVVRVAGVSDDARKRGDSTRGRRRGRARGDRSLP